MTTYNTYAEAKIVNKDKDIYELDGLFGTKPELIDCGVAGFIYKCNPADHCMSVEAFFEAGYKFVEGDKFLSFDDIFYVVGSTCSTLIANQEAFYDNMSFVLSAKALGEAKRGSLQSLKKKALSNPKVKEEYDTLEPEFEKVEWKNGDSCTFSNSCLTGVYVAYDNYNAGHVVYSDGKYFHVIDSQLSKPETPEQKKERELESLTDDACELLFGEPINNCRPDVAATVREMILAGYRKPE